MLHIIAYIRPHKLPKIKAALPLQYFSSFILLTM